MKVLITGIDGFTGKHLESYLQQNNYDVFGTIISKSNNPHHLQCDIRKEEEVINVISKIKPDYIFHLAAISFVGESNKSMIYDINVLGTQHILDALVSCEVNPKKVIIASSATVYGNQNNSSVLSETMCPKPLNHYAYSKLAMEHLITTYFDKLNILITRPFNYTGIGHSNDFIIPKIVNHFKAKTKEIELGNVHVAREFNDIRTIIDMYVQLMTSTIKSDIVNLCTGNDIKLLDVINEMEKLAGYKIKIKVNPKFVRKNELSSLKGSIKKLSSIIEINNTYVLTDTLKTMYEG